MEAKDLRIGNITSAGVVNEILQDRFYVHDGESSLKSTWFDIQPMPITEEWLLKFGFEKSTLDEDNAWLNLRYRYLNFSSDESVEFKKVYLTVSRMDIICEYVHELQNLYFALTGEELTIKKQ